MFNSDLIEDVARRKAVLFLGSGVTASALMTAGGPMMQWEPFLRSVGGKITETKLRRFVAKLIVSKDYLMACELIRDSVGKDEWDVEMTREFARAGSASDLHRAIATLDQRIVITTNFDKLFESAWQQCNPGATHYPKVVSSVTPEVFRMLRENDRYIIKIHGSIDQPETMIFSKSDYSEHAFGNIFYMRLLETLLETHTFVFIGFSMNDPAISFLVETHAYRFPHSRPHYIFLGGNFPRNYIEASKRVRRLFVIPYPSKNNHAALSSLISQLGRAASDWRRQNLLPEIFRDERSPPFSATLQNKDAMIA